VIHPFDMLVSPDDTICSGRAVSLHARKAQRYLWSPSTGLSGTDIADPVATPAATTNYQVIGYDDHHCFTDTGHINITVGPNPALEIGPDVTASAGSSVTFNPVTQNGPIVSWNWSPSTNLSCADCPNPIATVANNTTYLLTVENTYGCLVTDTVVIITFCKNSQVFIPNAFTPDGDGINDVLMVRGNGITVKSFRVFNRWGNVVFEKQQFSPNDPRFGWDGKVRGVLASPDVYVFTAEVTCDNGVVYTYKGNTTILK
jgi:gliding motility-associated-like protein